jgi:hypothetical protein
MVFCKIGEPYRAQGWTRNVCELDVLDKAPTGPLVFDHPRWSESRIEWSLLKHPSFLAKALGVEPSAQALVLRQVSDIDLYVRADGHLHLVEVKGLKGAPFNRWQGALNQIVRYWCNLGVWLRRGDEAVTLWALCPIRWSRSRGVAVVPQDWRSTIDELRQTHLKGPNAPELRLAFYSLFQHSGERLLLIWRAEEDAPQLTLKSEDAYAGSEPPRQSRRVRLRRKS